jgi:hypothetical protein
MSFSLPSLAVLEALLGSLPSRSTVMVMSSLYRREWGGGMESKADTCSRWAPPRAFLYARQIRVSEASVLRTEASYVRPHRMRWVQMLLSSKQ